MEKLDLHSFAKEIKQSYDQVVSGDLTYQIYTTSRDSSLKPTTSGTGDITDFVSEFEESAVQFGIIRVNPFGSDVVKLLLIGWCPDSAPLKSKISFAPNLAEVGRILHYHVQVTARDSDDLDVQDLLKRVSDASGARYSIQSIAKQSAPVKSFKPTPKPASPSPSSSSSEPVKPKFGAAPKISSTKPTPAPPAKKPLTSSSNNDNDGWEGEEELEERDFHEKPLDTLPGAYKPVKVDINALRKGIDNTTESKPEQPKTISLSTTGLSSLPKPKVSNLVSSRYQQQVVKPEFGASSKKPNYSDIPDKNDSAPVYGGSNRNFLGAGKKTAAQEWAEKHGKYTEVANSEKPINSSSNENEGDSNGSSISANVSSITSKFTNLTTKAKEEEEESEIIPKKASSAFPPPPTRSVPAASQSFNKFKEEPEEEDNDEEWGDEEEEEKEEEAEKPAPPARAPISAPTPAAAAEPVEEKETTSASAIAEYDYEKDEDNEISFEEGELIINIKFIGDDWWFGENSKGETGVFPASYVNLRESKNSDEPTPAASTVSEAEPAQAPAPALAPRPVPLPERPSVGKSAVAEYDYDAAEDNELSFKEGDIITNIEMADEDWWLGELNGERKLFPSNFVTLQD
ncbi:hypothetical protein BVG19_g425 [[Candida] boidinii]|nr:hypothetical protein BVG19_g425 [[Candida] boidinii]OWB50218.1 hypothetical protein B5S27_g1766 [[Candida] boidinii]